MWPPRDPVDPPWIWDQLIACERRLHETIEQFARDLSPPPPPSPRAVPLPLTERERTVPQLVTTGASNKQIARALHLSEGTIRNHNTRIFRKLGVAGRTTAALRYLSSGDAEDAAREPLSPRRSTLS